MNTFATIIKARELLHVTYYTIQIEGDSHSLFHQFLNDHSDEKYKKHLLVIRHWMTKIGTEIGAQEDYFRPEAFDGGDASALPPSIKITRKKCDLRLYCMRVNSNAVFLFSGAIKSKEARRAQDCDNVRPHFVLANKLTKAIEKALISRDITIHPHTGRLVFDADFTLELI